MEVKSKAEGKKKLRARWKGKRSYEQGGRENEVTSKGRGKKEVKSKEEGKRKLRARRKEGKRKL